MFNRGPTQSPQDWLDMVELPSISKKSRSKILYKLQLMNVQLKSATPYSRTITEITKNQAIQNGEEYGFGK